MDTRDLGCEFYQGRNPFALEMKTVTQYTVLILLSGEMKRQDNIPGPHNMIWNSHPLIASIPHIVPESLAHP